MTGQPTRTYHVFWSDEDREYVGICHQYPSLSWLADTPDAALTGIMEVVSDVDADIEQESSNQAC